MTRRAGAFLFLSLVVAGVAEAAPTCVAPARLMQWPAVNPKWEFCFLAPSQSGGSNGSGIELRDVYYNGHLVLKQAHAPILNVKYQPGGCGGTDFCFRDWSWQEVVFSVETSGGPASDGPGAFAEAIVPPQTVCDVGGRTGDVGLFRGVAAEKGATELILTSQFQAGWYRYTMKWKFYLDGRIVPWFGFAALSHPCTNFDHTHHVYWRFDFDVDGGARDTVEVGPPPANTPLPHPGAVLSKEGRAARDSGRTWIVRDGPSGRGYRVFGGTSTPVDAFAVSDFWFLRYRGSEIDDAGQPGPACAIKFNGYLNGEPVEENDVVVWARGGSFHAGGDLDDCHSVEVSLEPVGNWAPAPIAAPGVNRQTR